MSIKLKIMGAFNRMIRKGYWFNNIMFRDCKKLWGYNTFNTDVINLGSTSAVCAFDYSDIKLKCGNFAVGVNPLIGDLGILKNYAGYLKPEGAVVIITLCPFSSLAGRYDYLDDRYYTLLYPTTIPHFSFRRQQQVKEIYNMPVRTYPLWSMFSDLIQAVKGKSTKQMSEEQIQKDAMAWMNSWKKEFGIEDFSEPLSLINRDAISEGAGIINEMLAFCLDRKIRPVLLIPPIYHTLGEQFTPSIRKMIIESLLAKIENKDIWYHNYMDDEEFAKDITMFNNSFLLNSKGAKQFTKRVFKDIGLK